jgi:hypothetical protein
MDDTQANSPRSEFIVGLAIMAIGLFFLWAADDIPVSGEDEFGARSLPRAISFLIAIFGAIWSGINFVKWRHATATTQPNPQNEFLFARIFPLMLSSFIYAALFKWFGYLVSTFVVLLPVLYIYGNTSIRKILIMAAVAAPLYYIIFIKGMKVFDAGGSIINFNQLLGL